MHFYDYKVRQDASIMRIKAFAGWGNLPTNEKKSSGKNGLRSKTRYRDMDADALTDETHVKDSLWSQVVMEYGINFESCAESDCMIDFNRLNRDEEARDTYEDALDIITMQSFINQAQC